MGDFSKLIIGAILAEPESASIACELVTSEMFEDIDRTIFAKIEEITEQGRTIDILILASSLKKELAQYGGPDYLFSMAQEVTTASKLREYCLEQKQEYIGSLLRDYFINGAKMATNGTEAQRLLDFAQSGVDSISNLTNTANDGFAHISALTEKAIKRAEDRRILVEKNQPIGVPSGIRPLDRILDGGFKPSTLNVLAARPAMGKTAVMLHFAKSAAESGVPVCIYSLEMSGRALADRMLMGAGNIDIDAYKNGEIEDWSEVLRAQGVLNKLPMYIDANPQVSLNYIKNHSRRMAQNGKCGLILIDYLQLTDMASGEKNRNREQEVAQATRKCKILAKELDVPVILLSQLSRAVEESKEKIPQLSHLRESGAIEQDADVVMFLYRPGYYSIPEIEAPGGGVISTKGVGVIIVAKNREGATNQTMFKHNESLTQISTLSLQ